MFKEPSLETKKEYSLGQIDKCVSRCDWKSMKQVQDFCNLAILMKKQESADKISLFERKNSAMKSWFSEADDYINITRQITSLEEFQEYQKMLGRSIIIRGIMLDAFANDNFKDVKSLLDASVNTGSVQDGNDDYREAYEALANAYDFAESDSDILNRKGEFLTKAAYGTLEDITTYKDNLIEELSSEEIEFLNETIKFRS